MFCTLGLSGVFLIIALVLEEHLFMPFVLAASLIVSGLLLEIKYCESPIHFGEHTAFFAYFYQNRCFVRT